MVRLSRRLGARRGTVAAGVLFFALSIAFMTPATMQGGNPIGVSSTFTPGARLYLPVVAAPVDHVGPLTCRTWLPLVISQSEPTLSCPAASSAVWDAMQPWQNFISGAATSPDLNIYVRGWVGVDEYLGFVRYDYPPDDPPDTEHPLHLSTVTASDASSFVSTYQVNDWDWSGCNCAVPRTSSPYTVTMLGLRTTRGQPLYIPSRDTPVDEKGFTAMILYADQGQLALKYTSEDRVDTGYLVHLVNLCVDPNLVDLYQRLDADERRWLPVVYNSSVIGTALGNEVDVIVRDSGAILDPRSRQDWWQDVPPPMRSD